jgi:hypothetical protein
MNAGFIALVSALGGVVLGFILNEFHILLVIHRDDKRRLRGALFSLLNFRHLITPLDFKVLGSVVMEWARDRKPNEVSEMTDQALQEVLRRLIQPIITSIREKDLEKMSESYEKAMEDIATIDPILAYSLSGRSRVPANFRQYVDSLEARFRSDVITDNNNKTIDIAIDSAKVSHAEDLHHMVEDDIRKIAKRIGIITRFKIFKFLKHNRMEAGPNLRRELFDMLDRTVPDTL